MALAGRQSGSEIRSPHVANEMDFGRQPASGAPEGLAGSAGVPFSQVLQRQSGSRGRRSSRSFRAEISALHSQSDLAHRVRRGAAPRCDRKDHWPPTAETDGGPPAMGRSVRADRARPRPNRDSEDSVQKGSIAATRATHRLVREKIRDQFPLIVGSARSGAWRSL